MKEQYTVGQIDIMRALRRNWIHGLGVLAATIIITIIVTAMQTPVYEASAQLIVAPATGPMDTADVIRSLETLERRTVVATFARMASTDESRTAVGARLRMPRDDVHAYRTHGSVVPNTNIIRIDTRGPDAGAVAGIANASADLIAAEAQALYRVYSLRVLSRARPPEKPAYPDRQRNLLVGTVVGLALAAATVLALERLRRPA